MADNANGQWKTTGGSTRLTERGLQPARVQYQPPVRPAASQPIQPPPAPRNNR